MSRKLTDISIRNLKPGLVRQEIADAGARGLYLILQPSGHRNFAIRYRLDGNDPTAARLMSSEKAQSIGGSLSIHQAYSWHSAMTERRYGPIRRLVISTSGVQFCTP